MTIKEFNEKILKQLIIDLKDVDNYKSFKNGSFIYDLGYYQGNLLINEIERLNNIINDMEKENKILKDTILKALEFINNHTYRWKDIQFGEMVEVEDFEPGLKPIELINILKNKFENK